MRVANAAAALAAAACARCIADSSEPGPAWLPPRSDALDACAALVLARARCATCWLLCARLCAACADLRALECCSALARADTADLGACARLSAASVATLDTAADGTAAGGTARWPRAGLLLLAALRAAAPRSLPRTGLLVLRAPAAACSCLLMMCCIKGVTSGVSFCAGAGGGALVAVTVGGACLASSSALMVSRNCWKKGSAHATTLLICCHCARSALCGMCQNPRPVQPPGMYAVNEHAGVMPCSMMQSPLKHITGVKRRTILVRPCFGIRPLLLGNLCLRRHV